MPCSSSGDLVATGIKDPLLYRVWPELWPLLKPAYEKSDLKLDLLSELLAHRCALFAVYAKNGPVAGIVSRFLSVEGTSSLNCRIWLVGGARMPEWLPDFMAKITPWAKAEGCDRISGAGRKGWIRTARRLGCVRVADEDGVPCWELRI